MTNQAALLDRADSPAQVLIAARERRQAADRAEADLLQLAVAWAVMHPPVDADLTETRRPRGDVPEAALAIAGEGCPQVAEYSTAEFAAAVGLSTEGGKCYLGHALELRYRLPRLWKRVVCGDLPAWKARRIADETIRLTPDAAAFVDTHLAPTAHKTRPSAIDRAVNEAIGRFMPDEVERLAEASWDRRHVTVDDQQVSFTGTMPLTAELDIADALDLEAAVAAGAEHRAALGSPLSLDVRRAQALGDLARGQLPLDLAPDEQPEVRVKPRQVVLYVHLSEQALAGIDDPIARLERGNALVSVDQVRTWCGDTATASVVVKPVIDLDTCQETSSATVPVRIAEHIALRDRTCVFPWCTRPARSSDLDHPCDCDHVTPSARGGPTCSCNLAPLCRRHHRLKTHTAWTYFVVDPGTYLWTTPHGYQLLRDPTGTTDVTPSRRQPE